MCYSAQVSVQALVINIVSCAILFFYDKVLAGFFVFVGLMQLYDYIFWNNLSRNKINWVTTKVAMLSNNLQPIVLGLLIMFVSKKPLEPLSIAFFAVYAIVALIYSVYVWNKLDYTLVDHVSSPSLHWKWNGMPGSIFVYSIYLVTLFLLFFQNFPHPMNRVLAILTVISFVFSWHYYKGRSIGRFWCHIASLIPSFFVIYYVFIAKRKQILASS